MPKLQSTIVHRNHFFRLYQQNKSFESKVREPSSRCKRFLKLPNLHMLIKHKSPSFPRNWALGTFGESLKMFSTKVNLLSENISKSCNLDDSGVSLPIFPSRTNLKLHNISVTPKMV